MCVMIDDFAPTIVFFFLTKIDFDDSNDLKYTKND